MIIGTRTRKIWRDLTSRKFRTLMVSASIFVGVLGVIALSTVSDLLVSRLKNDLKENELAMITLSVIPSHDAEVDNTTVMNLLNRGSNVPALAGITQADGMVVYPLGFKHVNDPEFKDGFLKSYTSPLNEVRLEPPRLYQGSWPGPGEVVIERRMAAAQGFRVGDTIVLRTVSANGMGEISYMISGLVYQPYTDKESVPETSVFTNYADAQAILGFNGCNYIRLRYETFKQAEANFQLVQQFIAENTPYVPVFATNQDPAQNAGLTRMTSIGNILTMLAMVTMIISGFLVVNVIQTVVIEQKRQIGVIKSLGGTRLDIFSIYAGLAVTYGMLGTILAVILGIPLGFFLTDKLGKQFFVMVNDFDWSPKSVLMGASMGMGVPFLAAVWPVLNGTRVSILQALTDLGIKKSFGRSRLERWAAQLPLPITIRQAVANVVQKRSQLTLTLITLTLASAAFMGVTAVTISLIGEVNTIFKRMDYQIVVIPNQTQSQTTMESLMMEIDGVAQVVPTSSVSVEVHGDYTNFFTNNAQVETLGIDTTAVMFNFDFKSGGGWDGDANREGVVITSPMARQLGVKAGDNITLTIAGTIVTVPILGVDRSAFDFIYMEWHQLAQIAGFVQTPTSENSTEQQSPAAIPNAYLIRINKDHPTANDVDNIINALKIHLMEAGIDGTFQNQITKNKSITDLIGVFGSVMLVAAVLIGMVGAIGLLTMLTMGVFERQREIGVMRSIGAGSRTIAGQFLCEGLLVGLLAWVIGVPLSYLLAVMLNNTMGFETVDFRYRLSIPFIGLGSMLAVTILSSVGPSLAAARKTVSDILRYQ